MTDLDKLIAAVEVGDGRISSYLLPEHEVLWPKFYLAGFRGSIDAALALRDAILPEWFLGMSQNIHSGFWYCWAQDRVSAHFSATEECPARAGLLAILKAYRSETQK